MELIGFIGFTGFIGLRGLIGFIGIMERVGLIGHIALIGLIGLLGCWIIGLVYKVEKSWGLWKSTLSIPPHHKLSSLGCLGFRV